MQEGKSGLEVVQGQAKINDKSKDLINVLCFT